MSPAFDPAVESGAAGEPTSSVPWRVEPAANIDTVGLHGTLTDLVAAAWGLRSVTHELALGRQDGGRADALAAEVQRRSSALKTLNQRLVDMVQPVSPTLVAELDKALGRWQSVTARVVALAAERGTARARALSEGEAAERLAAVGAAGLEISTAAEAGARQVRQSADKTYSTALKTAVPALLLAIAAALMLGVWWSRRETPAAPEPRQERDPVVGPPPELSSAGLTTDVFTIDELARRTDLLAVEAEMAAARVDELGKCFAEVATEVRKQADRSQSAAEELSELPYEEREAKESALVDRMLSDVEVMATLVIEMTDAIRAPGLGGGDDEEVDASGPPWTDAHSVLDHKARRVIATVSKFRPAAEGTSAPAQTKP